MAKTGAKVTIKKYANRRLYDTESSAYITLDRLAAMIREGRDFEGGDAKTGDDITHQVLTQIIVEEEAHGGTMLPVNFLRQLIGMYGGSMQAAVPEYLEAGMDGFSKNQEAMRDAFKGNFSGTNVFADLAKRNMAMFEEAGRAYAGSAQAKGRADKQRASEVDKLRAELAALQAKVEALEQSLDELRNQTPALTELRKGFDERLAVLQQAQAGQRARDLLRRPARLGGKVKAGSGF